MDSIFRSARLKLTLFYMVILVGLSLTLTFGFRVLAEHEYERSSSTQYGQVRHLFVRYPWDSSPLERPEVAFGHIQSSAEIATRARLNQDFLLVNLAALIVGGLLSYVIAGRTLKPIEEAHAVQARFAADASHELRTPLTAIKLENEVFLRQKHFSESEARQQLRSNLEEVQRLEQLASNLLQLTRYNEGTLDVQPVAIGEVVNSAVTQSKTLAAPKQIHLQSQLADPKTLVLVNGESIQQLISIILENAIKYSPDKTHVMLNGEQQNEQYVLRIIDQGSGIAEEDLPRIFERLYRGDKARSSQVSGYGLGLALAEQIAQANDATVTAANNDHGKGACFTVYLPVQS